MPAGTPEILPPRNALALDCAGIVEASAGTGKTFTIAEIFLALLRGQKTFPANDAETPGISENFSEKSVPEAPPRVREILVVTFTEAATGELKTRLRKRVREEIAKVGEAAKNAPAGTAPENREPAGTADLRRAEEEFDEAAIFTIHGFCLRTLKEFGIAPTRTENVGAPTGAELQRFCERWRARKIVGKNAFSENETGNFANAEISGNANGGNADFSAVSAGEIAKVAAEFLKNPTLVPAAPNFETDAVAGALFCAANEIPAQFRAQRKSAHDISHDETLTELRDALADSPALAKRIAARFRCAIVDEFQDTDSVQWEIFRRIFLANNRPIFCVGDPKQAIYEFRGGDVAAYRAARTEILEKSAEILGKSGGNTLTLGENWRSEPETIAAFNELFGFDCKIAGKLDAGTPKSPREIEFSVPENGLLEYAPVAFPKAKRAENPDVPAAVLKIAPAFTSKEKATREIACALVRDIKTLVRTRGVPAGKIAVLVSKNEEAGTIRRMLGEEKIPVATNARGSVLQEPIAQPLADLLRAMLEPHDERKFRRALLSPFFAGTREKILLADTGTPTHTENGANAESAKTDAAQKAHEAFAAAHEIWEKQARGFFPAFRKLADALGFFENFASEPNAARLAADTLHLTEILRERERRAELTPRELVADFEKLLADADKTQDDEAFRLRADSDADAVKIQTVHGSKGLEFEYVFLPTLWSRAILNKELPKFVKKHGGNDDAGTTALIFDSHKSTEKTDAFLRAAIETAETNEACAFYVALTRAKKRLVVYHAPQRFGERTRIIWNSYQKQIFEAAGVNFTETQNPQTPQNLPHWKIVALGDALSEEVFPPIRTDENVHADERAGTQLISDDDARRRFDEAENARKRIFRESESVFSFSGLIRASETEKEEKPLREDDESPLADANAEIPANAEAPSNAEANGELPLVPADEFARPDFFDLPAGTEFGSVAHAIFEQADFRSRANLREIVAAQAALLPAGTLSQSEIRRKLEEMTEANLRLPLALGAGTLRAFRLENLDASARASEMEFLFPLRRSPKLFSELFRIFSDWGGIYAETAAMHWPNGVPAGAPMLNIAGMMTGFIDLAFRAGGKFFILDWKTNRISDGNAPLTQSALRAEIVRHGYALQWAIYAVALRKFLQKSLGEKYDHARDFGGIVWLFVRWCAPFVDTETLTSGRLDALEAVLFEPKSAPECA